MEQQVSGHPKSSEAPPQGRPSDINDKIIMSLLSLNHIMRTLYEGRASQQRILIILDEVKSITQRDLTARLGVQPGSASEILSKLENGGLILRTASDEDRRTTIITLTDEGKRRALEAANQRTQRHVEMFSCLSKEEREQFDFLLEKLHRDWEQRYQSSKEGRRGEHHHHRCGKCQMEREGRHVEVY